MQNQVVLPKLKGSGQVIPGAAKKPQCIGCLNISKSNWPISFYPDRGLAKFDTEVMWVGLDGEKQGYGIEIHFCPVCGRSLKELTT